MIVSESDNHVLVCDTCTPAVELVPECPSCKRALEAELTRVKAELEEWDVKYAEQYQQYEAEMFKLLAKIDALNARVRALVAAGAMLREASKSFGSAAINDAQIAWDRAVNEGK